MSKSSWPSIEHFTPESLDGLLSAVIVVLAHYRRETVDKGHSYQSKEYTFWYRVTNIIVEARQKLALAIEEYKA